MSLTTGVASASLNAGMPAIDACTSPAAFVFLDWAISGRREPGRQERILLRFRLLANLSRLQRHRPGFGFKHMAAATVVLVEYLPALDPAPRGACRGDRGTSSRGGSATSPGRTS